MADTSLSAKLTSIIDLKYLFRFVLLLLLLYYGNLAYIAIIDVKGNLYSPFLDANVNYINWIRNSYLYTANMLTNLAGYNTHPTFPYRLSSATGRYVEMVYDCLGINFFCFWTAFVWANVGSIKTKLFWWGTGLFSIWFINCIRVALLLIAVINNWQYNRYLDHHTQFNLVAYALIGLFIVVYTKKIEKKSLNRTLPSILSPNSNQ